tara:strand:- start:129 stop:740 length:612 start_codon:yes stop_codon:yes gene_type:complete
MGNYANIADLVKEGKALNSIYKALNCVKSSTQAKGFDTRLGKLLKQLKAESTNGRISSAQLFRVGIKDIPKQRRSEALWFVENEEVARDFISKSKKGFTSLTALQRAMKQATKGEAKSNVGQTTEGDSEATISEAKPKAEVRTDSISLGTSKQSLVQAVKLWTQVHNISILEVAELLMDEADDPVTDFQATQKVANTSEELPF